MSLDVPDALASIMAAEESARRFTAEGGTGVVLRFAALYGPGSEQTESQACQARRHMGFVFGRRDAYVSSLHLADAGTAVVAALSAPAGICNAVDDEPVTKRQLEPRGPTLRPQRRRFASTRPSGAWVFIVGSAEGGRSGSVRQGQVIWL